MSHVFVSNRFEELLSVLGDKLFGEETSLFGRKLLILPTLSLKSPIYFELLKSRTVVTGIQTMELNNAVLHLARLFGGKSLNIPTASLLSLKLEDLLVKEEGMVRKKAQKMADLLSRDFLHYGKYGGEEFLKWHGEEGWQQSLFNRAFEEWDLPLVLDDLILKKEGSIEIHLFALPFMPPLYRRFFEKLAKLGKVYVYELSFCRMYMADLYSEWEKGRMKDREFLEGHHPVLANLGRMGREKFKVLEEKEVTELYVEEGLTDLQRDLLDDIEEAEGGISVHKATSKLREVEIIYSLIVPLLKTYKPSEIAIFAPDMSEYAALIHFVFGESIPYQITDLERDHPMIKMLELDECRWDVESVFALLPARFRIVKEWIEEEGVRWGLNEPHRKTLLGEGLLEEGGRGTWEGALENLIRSVAETSAIEFSKVELLAEFASFIQKLKREKEEMTLEEWTLYFRGFYPDFEGIGDIKGSLFPLQSVKRHFLKILKRKSGTEGANHVEAIRFSSLKIGSLAPYPVVVVMGLNQGAFPRVEVARSLCEIKGEYAPTVNDEDRHAFLELLGSIRGTCFMTYVESASPILEMLMRSLKVKSTVHPPFAFHHSYADQLVSSQTAKAARAYYGKKTSQPFIPEFLTKSVLKKSELAKVSVGSLIKLMKHPMKLYCNERLRVYLDEKKELGGEFTLSHLDKYKLKRNMLPKATLPHGWYKEIALEMIEEEKIQRIELNRYAKDKVELPDRLIFPALVLDGVVIEGSFDAEPKGFVEKLLMTHLGIEPVIEGADSGLLWLLEYYRWAKENMSPFHPNWAEPFLLGDQDKVKKEIEAATSSGFFVDPYLELIFRNKAHYSVEVMMETWRDIVAPFQEWL